MDLDPYFDLGWLAQTYGYYRSAIRYYRRSIRETGSFKAHYNLGTIWLARERYRDAVEAFRAAVRMRPDFAEAYNNLGVAYGRLGARRKAMTAYARATELDPSHPTGFTNLGLVLCRMGRRTRGAFFLQKALRLGRRDLDTKRWVGYALVACGLDVGKGIKLLESVRRQRPRDAAVLADLALAYETMGLTAKARRLAARAAALGLDDAILRKQARSIIRGGRSRNAASGAPIRAGRPADSSPREFVPVQPAARARTPRGR